VSKIGRSGGITAGLKILKSNFAQNITSNIIFRLPEGQPTHSSPFSIFDTFDLPSIFLCLTVCFKKWEDSKNRRKIKVKYT